MPVESPANPSLHKTSPAECRRLIERIQNSQTLQRSPRLRELLGYLAEATLAGEAVQLKEPAIGSAVYGRPAGYNTNDDNVVRMGVSQLRRKLGEFFAGEGSQEPIRVDVPRGSYGLQFQIVAAAPPVPEPAPEPVPEAAPVETPAAPSRRWWPAAAAGVAAVIVLLAIGTATWFAGRPAALPPAEVPFWQEAIGDGSGTLFVSEDVDFLAAVTATGRRPSLEAYADGRESALAANGMTRRSPVTATTQLSLRIATRLAAHQPDRFGRVRFLPAREVRLQDFKEKNVILVGSPRACPWLALFEESMNFRFEHDPVRLVSGFRNRSPRPGEAAAFLATPSDGVGGKVYSSVSLLPNLTRTGHVLILMGARTEGTAAAAEAVTTPRVLESILRAVGYREGDPVPHFEALLESRVIGNATAAPEVVAVRRHEAEPARLAAMGR